MDWAAWPPQLTHPPTQERCGISTKSKEERVEQVMSLTPATPRPQLVAEYRQCVLKIKGRVPLEVGIFSPRDPTPSRWNSTVAVNF